MATQSSDIKDAMNREFARMSGMLYDLNPRNFEDRWYALVGFELNMLCRRIKCNAVATAQDSIWAGNSYGEPLKLADVIFGDSKLDDEGEDPESESPVEEQAEAHASTTTMDDSGEEEQDFMNDWAKDVIGHPDMAAYERDVNNLEIRNQGEQGNVSPHSQTQHDAVPSASQEANDDAQQGRSSLQASIEQESPSGCTITGGNRHRVPDSAINGFVSIDFTHQAMKEATKKRQAWTTQKGVRRRADPVSGTVQPDNSNDTSSHAQDDGVQDCVTQDSGQSGDAESDTQPPTQAMNRTTKAIHDELSKLPPTDPDEFDALQNPYPLYRGHKVVEFKIVNAESKRLPSRHESKEKQPWDGALLDLMNLAQCGNLEQIRVFFASPQWNHQDSVMLFATAGDFQTHTIAKRDRKFKRPTFRIQPWSSPVWYGSAASKRREEKIVKWINTTFSPEAMMKVAIKLRDEAANRPQPVRERTPLEEGNVDGENGPSGRPRPSAPSDAPSASTTGKRNRNRNKLKGTEPTRISRRIRKGDTLGESVAERQHTDAPPPTPHIQDAEQVSSTDGERLALNNARDGDAAQPEASAPLGPAPPTHPTGKTRLIKRLPGGNVPGTSKPKDKGKGKARADPIVESDQDSDDDGSPLSPVLEAEEGSDASDEDQPARKKARTELPPEGPPSSCPPSPIEDDAQLAPFAATQPTASTSTQPAAMSTQPAASTSAQPAASTSTQPAASSSNQQSLERRRSARAPRPVQPFDAKGKKDAEKNRVKRLKRARTTPH